MVSVRASARRGDHPQQDVQRAAGDAQHGRNHDPFEESGRLHGACHDDLRRFSASRATSTSVSRTGAAESLSA